MDDPTSQKGNKTLKYTINILPSRTTTKNIYTSLQKEVFSIKKINEPL